MFVAIAALLRPSRGAWGGTKAAKEEGAVELIQVALLARCHWAGWRGWWSQLGSRTCKTRDTPLESLSSDGGARPDLRSVRTAAHALRSAPCAARTFLSASVSSSRDDHRLRSTRRGSALSPATIDGKGRVVLADQAQDEASSCRVELRFPLAIKPRQGFTDSEEPVIRDARAVLAAALVALDRR